jgi:putative nucleotidyltransferase with HDIG domain
MHRILVVGHDHSRPEELRRRLGDLFEITFQPLARMLDVAPQRFTLMDIDLTNDSELLSTKDWLEHKPNGAKIVFATDKVSRLQEARALALGASAIVQRPVIGHLLLAAFGGNGVAPAPAPEWREEDLTPAVVAASATLQEIFSAAASAAPLDSAAVQAASNAIVDQLEAQGLANWIDTVRMHHSQTYQHCLLVTGVAAAFGEHIGASRKDRQRLSFAGMLHDIGKARIPLVILEKPGRLDEAELAVMRQHPEHGLDALKASALAPEMLDMVVHHHELLDGSGYPHGLQGSEISDLVRIMTISDVFGALIERRSYKPPLSGEAAYQILLDMGPRLDKDLVRAFKFASRVGHNIATS